MNNIGEQQQQQHIYRYQPIRRNNEEQQPSTSNAAPQPPPTMLHHPQSSQFQNSQHHRPTIIPQQMPTTIPASQINRAVVTNCPPGRLTSIVVGEKVLVPAGVLRIQQPTSSMSDGTNGTWQQNSNMPTYKNLAPRLPSNSMSNGTIRPGAGSYDSVKKLAPKVVQAIPFTSTSSHSLNHNQHQPQQNHQSHQFQQQQQQATIPRTTWVYTPTVNSSISSPPTAILPANASVTPDSGIQSVSASPSAPIMMPIMTTVDIRFCEEKDEDFTDMPLLVPADQEDEIIDITPSTSFSCNILPESQTTTIVSKEDGASHGSECETTAAPSISISPSMDPDQIVKHLMALDPEKANAVAALIKKQTQPPRKRRAVEKHDETEVSSTTPSTPKPKRGRTKKMVEMSESPEIPIVTTSTDAEEPGTSEEKIEENASPVEEAKQTVRRSGRTSAIKKRPPIDEIVLFSPTMEFSKTEVFEEINKEDNEEIELKYRLAVQKQIDLAMAKALECCTSEMATLSLGIVAAAKKKKLTWLKSMAMLRSNVSKPGVKKLLNQLKTAEKEKPGVEKPAAEKEVERISRFSSRRSTLRNEESPETENIEGRFNGEYEEFPRSFATSEEVVSMWRAPTLSCGCTKGACTSDIECLNRAMRVQCSSDCLTLCANKKFWREDTSKLSVSNGPRTKRFLKTRIARRAGELLCEYAGEVIPSSDAIKRFTEQNDRILAIGEKLFVDANQKGNIGRYVKHSCKPNSRLEVWSIGGFYRAGIFTLYDVASNCEITIDKNGLLPADTVCNCGLIECKKEVKAARSVTNIDFESNESKRGRPKKNEESPRSGLPSCLLREDCDGLRKVFEAVCYKIRNIDGTMPLKFVPQYSKIRKFLRTENPDVGEFEEFMRAWLEVVEDDDLDRAYVAISKKWLPVENDKKKSSASRCRAFSTSSNSNITMAGPTKIRDADLSYLETRCPIGSYDPDDAWIEYKANANDNAVRCVCGALDEDGDMVQCDICQFWLHVDCVEVVDESDDYKCEFCERKIENGRPSGDVKLRSQPELRFEDCEYYKALVNRRNIQVRLNETVYVNKKVSDDHKILLRNLKEKTSKKKSGKDEDKFVFPEAPTTPIKNSLKSRKDSRIFRVERLFITPGNNRFVFGSFYAWPHETYVDTQKMLSTREVFPTTMYETLPLDEVIGRCMVIDVDVWCKGRPKVPKFKEDDVFLCEWQIGKNHRHFEKVPPRNRYPINTQPYVFETFSKPLEVVRDFRPYDRVPTPTQKIHKSLTIVDSPSKPGRKKSTKSPLVIGEK